MEGALHRFPAKLSQGSPQTSAEGPQQFEVLDVDRAEELLMLVRGQLAKIGDLIAFMDDQREEAQRLGIESIAIELCALFEGGRLAAVKDELVDAVKHLRRAQITSEGLNYVHRVEKLLVKAEAPLAETRKFGAQAPRNLLEGAPRLSAAPMGTDTLVWGSVAVAGLVVGILVVCHIVASPAKPRRIVMPGVDLGPGRKRRGST